MKTTKIFKAAVLSALLLAGSAGAALAQEQLVSGEPYAGFFEGVEVVANGPYVTDQVATEAPGNLVTVEGFSIWVNALSTTELASLDPEAVIGLGWAETDEDAEEAILIAMGQ